MFNWEKFKNGEIAVHCDTEEKAKDFLKKCDENNIVWESGAKTSSKTIYDSYKEDTAYCCMHTYKKLEYCDYQFYRKKGINIEKWGDKMEKTFREVIADIKEGEVWESENNSCDIRITRTKTGISIRDFNDNAIVWFSDDFRFKFKRKEYTFEEAFKAYEEGKEIESCIEGQRYKKEGGEDYYFDFNKEKYILLEWDKDIFTITSIRNKWYIND